MAQKIILVDDINGETAEETVRFSLDGVNFAIDLGAANAARLRESLAEFMEHGRRENAKVKTVRSATSTSARGTSVHSAARRWAQEQGMDVNPTGRVPESILDAYREAQNA